MSLPTYSTNVTKTIPSYLYFQYQNDPDLNALVQAYNTLTQEYVDWFNNVNLPIYSGLNGALLDWVGQGIYGIPRPTLAGSASTVKGQIASYALDDVAISDLVDIQPTTIYTTPDDVYQRVLTWWYYKDDGFAFTIPWLKRRIYRFLYGINGTNPVFAYTANISVTFVETPSPTCNIVITNTPEPMGQYLEAAIQQQVLALPFRFSYNVTLS